MPSIRANPWLNCLYLFGRRGDLSPASPTVRFARLRLTVANILVSSATSCLQQDTPRILVICMTAALAHIVEEIEVLTPGEKIELRRHIVERIPWSPDLDEDDYAALSAASFRALDEEEDRGA